MNDEWTRENQIKRTTLKAQILMPYMMGISIFSSLAVFIVSNSSLQELTKNFLVLCSVVALFSLFILLRRSYDEVDKIFQS